MKIKQEFLQECLKNLFVKIIQNFQKMDNKYKFHSIFYTHKNRMLMNFFNF